MSHPVILPPVHDTSPPPFDDDIEDNDIISAIQNPDLLSSASSDVLNNSNDDWKSIDDNNDVEATQCQNDTQINKDEKISTANNIVDEEKVQEDEEEINNDNNWANFTTFESKSDEFVQAFPVITTITNEENNDDEWADFESSSAAFVEPSTQSTDFKFTTVSHIESLRQPPDFESSTAPFNESPMHSFNLEAEPVPPISGLSIESNDNPSTHLETEEDDDFGEFSEVQVTPEPQVSSISNTTLTTEDIESLIATCFPVESSTAVTDDSSFMSTELPSFTSFKNPTKQISSLESSLSLWNVLSTVSNDPIGIKFQWRKSNTERIFHQALGVNERLRTKTVPLTPEILQPEKIRRGTGSKNETDNIENENKPSPESIRPHFDWKQSGLQNPLADDSASTSSNVSKNETPVFDANKALDLDFYVPPKPVLNEDESSILPSVIQKVDSPIIQRQLQQQQQQQQSPSSIPIKTMDLFPGSTTVVSDDAKRIIDNLPNLSFMSAKALMFPVRFNANNNDESSSLY